MRRTHAGSVVILILVLILVGVEPVRAAEEVSPPKVAMTLTTLRQRVVATFNGRPLLVCENDIESGTRIHGVCQALETLPETVPYVGGFTEGFVNEYVEYDGTIYDRFNQDTTWTSSPIEGYDPQFTTIQFFQQFIDNAAQHSTVSRIGSITVDGISGTQYQFWSHDTEQNKASGGQYVYDIALSDTDYPIFERESHRGTLEGLGDGELSFFFTYSDFGAPITVSPPSASTVQAARTNYSTPSLDKQSLQRRFSSQ